RRPLPERRGNAEPRPARSRRRPLSESRPVRRLGKNLPSERVIQNQNGRNQDKAPPPDDSSGGGAFCVVEPHQSKGRCSGLTCRLPSKLQLSSRGGRRSGAESPSR